MRGKKLSTQRWWGWCWNLKATVGHKICQIWSTHSQEKNTGFGGTGISWPYHIPAAGPYPVLPSASLPKTLHLTLPSFSKAWKRSENTWLLHSHYYHYYFVHEARTAPRSTLHSPCRATPVPEANGGATTSTRAMAQPGGGTTLHGCIPQFVGTSWQVDPRPHSFSQVLWGKGKAHTENYLRSRWT